MLKIFMSTEQKHIFFLARHIMMALCSEQMGVKTDIVKGAENVL